MPVDIAATANALLRKIKSNFIVFKFTFTKVNLKIIIKILKFKKHLRKNLK